MGKTEFAGSCYQNMYAELSGKIHYPPWRGPEILVHGKLNSLQICVLQKVAETENRDIVIFQTDDDCEWQRPRCCWARTELAHAISSVSFRYVLGEKKNQWLRVVTDCPHHKRIPLRPSCVSAWWSILRVLFCICVWQRKLPGPQHLGLHYQTGATLWGNFSPEEDRFETLNNSQPWVGFAGAMVNELERAGKPGRRVEQKKRSGWKANSLSGFWWFLFCGRPKCICQSSLGWWWRSGWGDNFRCWVCRCCCFFVQVVWSVLLAQRLGHEQLVATQNLHPGSQHPY